MIVQSIVVVAGLCSYIESCVVHDQAKLFKDAEAMHIVYAVCGEAVISEFLMSLKSLYLFAGSGLVRGPAYYHIHVLSDGAVTSHDMAFLRPLSHFKVSVHPTYPNSTMLFKQCSTERIYLHQHTDFMDLDKVTHLRRPMFPAQDLNTFAEFVPDAKPDTLTCQLEGSQGTPCRFLAQHQSISRGEF